MFSQIFPLSVTTLTWTLTAHAPWPLRSLEVTWPGGGPQIGVMVRLGRDMVNQRPILCSHHMSQPLRGQCLGHMIYHDPSDSGIQVTWSVLTNQRPHVCQVHSVTSPDCRPLSLFSLLSSHLISRCGHCWSLPAPDADIITIHKNKCSFVFPFHIIVIRTMYINITIIIGH